MNRARYRKHRSTASILLIITAIAAAVLIAAAVFVYFAGIRYMRYNYEAGYIKYFGRVDENGDPLSGTLVTAGMRATLTLSDGTLAPPPQESVEDMPRGEQGSAEDMPGSPQGGQQAPDASQYEDEISPPQADEGKKFDLFGWFS